MDLFEEVVNFIKENLILQETIFRASAQLFWKTHDVYNYEEWVCGN